MGHVLCTLRTRTSDLAMLMLTNFSVRRPHYELDQARALHWLAGLHATAQASLEDLSEQERATFAIRFAKLVERCACGPERIGKRGHVTADLGSNQLELYDVRRFPRGVKARPRGLVCLPKWSMTISSKNSPAKSTRRAS